MWHDTDDDLDDRELPDPDDSDEDDETVPCPHCRESVYEDAERCPNCGLYLSREDAPRSRPAWVVVAAVICLGMVAYSTFWMFR